MTPHPSTLLAVAALAAVLGAHSPAAAQQRDCGDSYTIQRGDTLSAVARRCGVALPELLAANPGIEPRRLGVGQSISLPGAAPPQETAKAPPEPATQAEVPTTAPITAPAPTPAQAPEDANYTVRAADSLAGIAQRHGISVTELVRDNPQLNRQTDLKAGQRLLVRGASEKGAVPTLSQGSSWASVRYVPGVAVEVLPRQVTPGDSVTIYARGFPGRQPVEIAVGDPAGRMVVVDTDTTDNYGTLRARIPVPPDVNGDGPVAVAVATPDRRMAARSATLNVVGAGAMTQTQPGAPVEVTGTLTDEGIECQALRAPDGTLYTLAGNIGDAQPGDRVRVVGLIAGASICQQGITLSTARVQAVRPDLPERAER